ncbi:flagellar biosynthesis regulator FlaF [uncultured Devosia sp.]|uniref:flagellar biosynthesis regulator FlaF n=1 Tax=uncultured Devosia sp. TaxID=211434 RepID=UPI0035CC06A9
MQQYGAQAYQQTAKTVESPRERESALLIKAAASLQNVRDEWPSELTQLTTALAFNRKLWTILMTSVTREDSALPQDVRQNVANLGIYILNETREMLLSPTNPGKLDALININRQLAAGLRGN